MHSAERVGIDGGIGCQPRDGWCQTQCLRKDESRFGARLIGICQTGSLVWRQQQVDCRMCEGGESVFVVVTVDGTQPLDRNAVLVPAR